MLTLVSRRYPHSTYVIVICTSREWPGCIELHLKGDVVDKGLRALLTFEKYETTNYHVSGMRRYTRNVLQWNKNDIKSTRMTNRDYSNR